MAEFQTFNCCYSIKSMINVAQILQGLSYKVFSKTSPNFIAFGLFILLFGIPLLGHMGFVVILLSVSFSNKTLVLF